jgi:putative copper resistance protein D
VSESLDLGLVGVRFAVFALAVWLFGAGAFDAYAPAPPARGPMTLRLAGPILQLLATSAYLVLLAREAAGGVWPDATTVGSIYAGTGFGMALAIAQAAAAFLCALVFRPADTRWPRLVVSGVGLAALALVGHAADDTGVRGAERIAVLAAHLLAVGAWLGALPRLWQALDSRRAAPLELLRRFGIVGGLSVFVVVGTGLMTLAFVVVTARGQIGPAYGRTLLVKLAIVAALLGLAAINRVWLTPLLPRREAFARRALRLTIVLEQVLGLAALASVAVLGQLDPTM